MIKFITSIFGSRNQRVIKTYSRKVDAINALADQYKALSDSELAALTPQLKQSVADGTELDDVLPEAFAAVHVP